MRLLIGIFLLVIANTAMADIGQAIEKYRQYQASQNNQANQNNQSNQNNQTSTQGNQTSTTDNAVIYAPGEQPYTVPHDRAEAAKAGYKAGNNNNVRMHRNIGNHHRGAGSMNR